jgi:hypothetical protein
VEFWRGKKPEMKEKVKKMKKICFFGNNLEKMSKKEENDLRGSNNEEMGKNRWKINSLWIF